MNQTLEKAKTGLLWYHWLVVACSLMLTFVAWYVSSSQIQQKIGQRFNFQSELLLTQISERMSLYEEALKSGVANIYAQSRETDVNRWRVFSEALSLDENYPGINGIGVIYYVPPEELSKFLEKQRLIRPDFLIKPAHEQSEFWPITYIEPVASNAQAVGLDMAFEENRWTAAKLARNTGTPQITGPITLVQDAMKTPGFLKFVPFYSEGVEDNDTSRREHFIGHVYAPFIMHKLMKGTLGQKNRQLLFSVHDGSEMLYDELNETTTGFDPTPLYSKEVSIPMYGRTWQFHIQTARSFRDNALTNQPRLILVAGLIINIMLLLLFYMLSNSHKKATQMANAMTKELAVSQKYFRHVINSAPCGIVTINDKGIIESVNLQMTYLTGYEAIELIDENIDRLVPQPFREKHKTLRESYNLSPATRRMGFDGDTYCLKKNGDEFPAEIGLAHFSSDNQHKVIATVVDLTKRTKVADELKRSNKELNNFAYVASHDLKAPLRGIMQLANWIEEDLQDKLDEETAEHLNLMQNRVARLEGLLDDLLSYSRIGRKHGDFKQVNITEMLHSLFELLVPPPGFTLTCDDNLPEIVTLCVPLEQIFRNLINNAIKHHDSDQGHIHISAQPADRGYTFIIEDDGPGIPPDQHDRVFRIFQTLRPRDEVEGSGMGLAIIKKLLDYYHCTITVESDGQRGTRMIFTWPDEKTLRSLLNE